MSSITTLISEGISAPLEVSAASGIVLDREYAASTTDIDKKIGNHETELSAKKILKTGSKRSISYATPKLLDVSSDNAIIRKTASILSPLRYPGSKRRFAGYVAETLRVNKIRPQLFVEPFAGGASVALQMLGDDLVENIGLAEKDPLLADFWHTVFFDAEWLIQSTEELQVNLDTWHYYKQLVPTSRREHAMACLFLNRTNFSGILRNEAGPIGGIAQASQYDIGCRFPKRTLIKRIQQAAALSHRVLFICNMPWADTLDHASAQGIKAKDLFVYLDPPFYDKAAGLYRFHFADDDHRQLRDALKGRPFRWLLSYDDAEFIRQLYSDRRSFQAAHGVELLYTIARSKSHNPVKEIVVTNLPHIPIQDRVWRTTAQW